MALAGIISVPGNITLEVGYWLPALAPWTSSPGERVQEFVEVLQNVACDAEVICVPAQAVLEHIEETEEIKVAALTVLDRSIASSQNQG